MKTVTVDCTDTLTAPGFFKWIEALRARDIAPDARDEAARLWMLASVLPTLSGESLLDIVTGRARTVFGTDEDAEKVFFEWPEEEEDEV
jgi:hypothetical protein